MAHELGIVGAGNMAEAITRGVLRAGLIAPGQIVAADVSPRRRELFADELHVRVVEQATDAARGARVLLLSVKPQQMKDALAALGAAVDPAALIVSIAAGISTGFIERSLGPRSAAWRVVRTMPNTPMLVGMGMTAIARGAHASADDLAYARSLFESAGAVVEVDESQIDAVTAVSGSGPAYVFYLVEQMIAAGVELGLSPEASRQLAAQTALGAATMLATSADTPAELRRKVTSPGGTTQAAITHLESGGAGPLMREAVKAAARRSAELGM
jgi:pyrroline-5-carboxylate reductase